MFLVKRLCRPLFPVFGHCLFALTAQAQPQLVRENPEISVNGLFLSTLSSEGHKEGAAVENGFSLQEIELRLLSNVDPYFRAEFMIAIHPEHRHGHGHDHDNGNSGGEGDEHSGGLVFDLEEAFIETISLPGFSIRAGKFFAILGRHNQLHTHYFPFIDAPITHTEILGDHGLNEIGVALSYLVPTPWFSEVTFQAFSGDNENLFNADDPGRLAGIANLRNLWDVTSTSNIELNLGYGHGANDNNDTTQLYNAAFTYRWRPLTQGIYQSMNWTTEYLQAEIGGAEVERKAGVSTWLQYQFARRWWVQGRAEHLEIPDDDHTENVNRYSALLGFVPSEFSALRLQFDHFPESHFGHEEQRVSLQWNISIGAHPAHTY